MIYNEDQDIRIDNIQSRGFVIKDNSILVMFRRKNGEEYYVFPGGHMEIDDTPEETALREVEEETTIKCTIQRKAYEITDYSNGTPQIQHFYVCDYVSGEPELSGEESRRSSSENFYKPMWLKLADIINSKVYPVQSKEWVKTNLIPK